LYCLDASVVVNSIIEKEPLHEYGARLLDRIMMDKTLVVFPNIAIPEIASALSRGTGDASNAKALVRSFIETPNFTFITIKHR
jgi:predicted nucleic acid-binding protein